MNFGEKIKKLRTDNGWTQEYVAKHLNISVPALSRYESGMYEPKSMTIIHDFAKLYNVSADYLLGLDVNFEPDVDSDIDIAFYEGYKGLNEEDKEVLRSTLKAFQRKGGKNG